MDHKNSEPCWYIVYTKPRAEKKLNQILVQNGIETYLPLKKEKKQWSDRIVWTETPLFTSYLFLKIDFWEERAKVIKYPQFLRFIFEYGKPAVVDEETIRLLDISLQSYQGKIKLSREKVLKKGVKVRVLTGPFQGKTVEVLQLKNKSVVVIRIPGIESTVNVNIDADQLAWEELVH